jgi:hypothetical protein
LDVLRHNAPWVQRKTAGVPSVIGLESSTKPGPLVTRPMALADAAEANAVHDRREALTIVLTL